MSNISIVWDFDKTLVPEDSTSKVIDVLLGEGSHKTFWDEVKFITGKKDNPDFESLLGSDAPTWMYALSRAAAVKQIPLNTQFFREFVAPHIELFPNVLEFLSEIKALEKTSCFKKLNLKINHFIVSAGLQHLVEEVMPDDLIKRVFGCRYMVRAEKGFEDEPESIPVFCMDETVKTRSLFEISKGSFLYPDQQVNKRVTKDKRFSHFSDFIYIGDGPTDIPALSLTRYKGGLGIVVYNPDKSTVKLKKDLKSMALDKRADLITPADYSLDGELFKFIEARCIQIRQRYEAEHFA